MVPIDVNSPQPNPACTTMQDDAHHANPEPRQIMISHAELAGWTHQKGGRIGRRAPFSWGANAPIFRRLLQEVGMFRSRWTAVLTALCIAVSASLKPTAGQCVPS